MADFLLPARYTETDITHSHGYKLTELIDRLKQPLDEWQKWLLVQVLACDDKGQLLYPQVLVSVPRQNGKSWLVTWILLFHLLMLGEPRPAVIGVASTAKQARIIYDYAYGLASRKPLGKFFSRVTVSQGMTARNGGTYDIKPASSAALQGLAIQAGLIDEVHIAKQELWQAMINGTTARKNAQIIAVTTAGDDNSLLLKDLYGYAEQAMSGELQRFGAFIYEAPELAEPTDPDALLASNPALYEGRLDLDQMMDAVSKMPRDDAVRYKLNRFVSGSKKSWIPNALWLQCGGEVPELDNPVFTVERSLEWQYASIVASQKIGDKTYTELVLSMPVPTTEKLMDECLTLNQHRNRGFIMDVKMLSKLAEELNDRGVEAVAWNYKDVVDACALAYAEVARGNVVHANDSLVNNQNPKAIRKNVGEGWAINRRESGVEIDAIFASILGIAAANVVDDDGVYLFGMD